MTTRKNRVSVDTHIHRVLTEALEHAVKKKLISRNPAKDINTVPKPKKFRAGTLTSKQVSQILRTASDQDDDIIVPITFAALCGLRRGESCGVLWSDIDFEKQTLTVSRQLIDTENGPVLAEPKSEDSVRTVFIPQSAIEILKKFKDKQDSYKIFFGSEYKESDVIYCEPNGSVISPCRFSKRFGDFIKKHNLPKVRYHDLRHTYASLLLEADVNLKVVSELLGHSSMAITADIYTHVLDSLKKNASDKLNDLLQESNKIIENTSKSDVFETSENSGTSEQNT